MGADIEITKHKAHIARQTFPICKITLYLTPILNYFSLRANINPMALFFVLTTRNLIGMVVAFLLAFSSYSSAQTPQLVSNELLVKQPIALPWLQPANPPSRASIRLLKMERRKLQRLSNLLKRRASGTNALLSASETTSQQNTHCLVKALSKEIDSLQCARRQLRSNNSDALTDPASQALPTPLVTTSPLKEKIPVPGIEQAAQGKKLASIRHIDQVKGFRLDSAKVDEFIQNLVQKTEYGQQVKKLESNQQLLQQAQRDVIPSEADALQNKEQLQKYAEAKAAKLATSEFAQFAPQIQQAQQKFTKYKRKMEWLKEGSGKNANSLKGDSLSKRMIYGGNFQLTSMRPFSIVIAPLMGYRLNKKISMGVSISYKSILGKTPLQTKAFGGEIGYRVFADYKLVKSWFGHFEFESMNKSITNSTMEGYDKTWQNNGYIGIGRQIGSIKGVKITSIFLCNLFDKRLKNFEPAAFQFRVGLSK